MDKTTRAIAERRVKAGIAALDLHRPGWLQKINSDELDLSDTDFCVLGQLSAGDYANLVWTLEELDKGIDENGRHRRARWGVDHGFERDTELYSPDEIPVSYTDLNTIWKEQIELRRAS